MERVSFSSGEGRASGLDMKSPVLVTSLVRAFAHELYRSYVFVKTDPNQRAWRKYCNHSFLCSQWPGRLQEYFKIKSKVLLHFRKPLLSVLMESRELAGLLSDIDKS